MHLLAFNERKSKEDWAERYWSILMLFALFYGANTYGSCNICMPTFLSNIYTPILQQHNLMNAHTKGYVSKHNLSGITCDMILYLGDLI